MEKTKIQIEKEAMAYLNKTSLHAFMTDNDYIYKIITFENEGKRYYATLLLSEEKVIINVQEVVSDRQFAYYGNNTLNVLKSNLFPKWYKTKAIPNFKKLREITEEFRKKVKVDKESNVKLSDELLLKVAELKKVN